MPVRGFGFAPSGGRNVAGIGGADAGGRASADDRGRGGPEVDAARMRCCSSRALRLCAGSAGGSPECGRSDECACGRRRGRGVGGANVCAADGDAGSATEEIEGLRPADEASDADEYVRERGSENLPVPAVRPRLDGYLRSTEPGRGGSTLSLSSLRKGGSSSGVMGRGMLNVDAVEGVRTMSATSSGRVSEAGRRTRGVGYDDIELCSGMLSASELCDPAVLVLVRPLAERFCQDVGGSDVRGLQGVLVLRLADAHSWSAVLLSSSSAALLYDRDKGCLDEPRDEAEERRDRFREDIRRVRGEGASSSSLSIPNHVSGGFTTDSQASYLSLQPKPVVKPMPPRNSRPSLWRVRRLGVSLSSFSTPDLVIIEAPANIHVKFSFKTKSVMR